ncbi:MAG: family 10 glycosylhydrolase [Clostridia bacterium]|nr:family 10 glycosylhydrolase [Clostridia bacterium]
MKRFSIIKLLALVCFAAMLIPMLVACSEDAGESSVDSSSAAENTSALTVTVGETEYVLGGEVNTEDGSDGVYIYTRESGKTSVPKSDATDKSFFDVAVINDTVVAVFDSGSTAVIPESGYIIRFRNVDASIELGAEVECDAVDIEAMPEKYVRFGDVVIEVGHENEERTSEETGWLYDENWYTGITESNMYCTEIAVSDGKIVDINRSGDNLAGISIPADGYVLVVGQGTALDRKTTKLNVGDSAELVESDGLYTFNRYGYAGENRTRPEDGIVIYTASEQSTTPVGDNLLEVAVNESGVVTEMYVNCSGIKNIPENGYIVSATGMAATQMAREVTVGASVLRTGARSICFVTNPVTELDRLAEECDAIREALDSEIEKLSNVDFMKVASIYNSMEEHIALAEATLGRGEDASEYNGFDGDTLAQCVSTLKSLASEARVELVPYVTVQDRAAWVTLGEYDYSQALSLHYKTQADVDHTVRYAKNCGLNTLIIDNIVIGFSVYESKVPGLIMLPQLNGLDLIDAFKKACDENGIRLIVMVNSFSSGLDGVFYPENHYMSIYKDKYLKTNKGGVVGPDKVITLDPADKDVQAFNLAIISEIAEKYDVYGVQADYMRYPLPYYYQEHNYEDFGYNESSVSGFVAKYGKDPATIKISDPLWDKWCAWRRDIISDYQKRFYETVKSINPELHVSFTCFADYRDRQMFTYQDVEKWAANGYADAIYPMIYGDNTEYQLKYATEILPVTEYTSLVLGIGTYVRASHESIREQLVMPYDVCGEGFGIFTLRYIATCGYGETIRNALRYEATPATAPDAELIPACTEMLEKRILNLRYAAAYKGGFSEEQLASLDSLAESVSALGSTDFESFAETLKSIKTSTGENESIPDFVKEALDAAFDYVIGLE